MNCSNYYVEFAKGGVELIWVEGIAALEPAMDGSPTPAETIEFGKKLAAECGKYGAKLGYQWAEFAMTPVADMKPEDIAAVQADGVGHCQTAAANGLCGTGNQLRRL